MERFIARENIGRFRQQLAQCTDEGQRHVLQQLLAEEEARLAELQRAHVSRGK